jgi:hypothetical protein
LSNVDLPTFGLPTIAITPQRWPGTDAGALAAANTLTHGPKAHFSLSGRPGSCPA